MTLDAGRTSTWRLPRFSALKILRRQSLSTDTRTILLLTAGTEEGRCEIRYGSCFRAHATTGLRAPRFAHVARPGQPGGAARNRPRLPRRKAYLEHGVDVTRLTRVPPPRQDFAHLNYHQRESALYEPRVLVPPGTVSLV